MAVTFDTSVINVNNTNFTVGNNANRILIVVTINSTGATPVTAVTYNSAGLTQLDASTYNTGVGEFKTWYLLNPDTGLNALAFTGGSAFNATAYSYYGVGQVAPEAHQITTGTGTSISSALVTITANAVVFAAYGAGGALGGVQNITYSTNMGNDRNPVDGMNIDSVASNAQADSGAIAVPASTTSAMSVSTAPTGGWAFAQIAIGEPQTAVPFKGLLLSGVGT